MKARIQKLREHVRGIEHLVLGATTTFASSLILILEKMQNQDLTPLLQRYLPSNWTPAEAVCAMGVAMIVLHVFIGNQAKWQPPPDKGDDKCGS